MATKDEELEKEQELATRNDNSDTSGDTDANAGGGATLPTGKEERKIGKQVRQERREANQQRRQAEREERREDRRENGTAIGNEFRALGRGLKEEWQRDMDAIKGRRSGDPAAKTTEESPEAPAPENPTPTNVEPTEVTQPKEEVSPAPTTEETAVEKTDGTDVDGDLTPEQVVSKYGGDAERLKEAGFNPDGTPLSVDDEDNDDTELAESNVNPDEVAVAKGGTPNGGDLTALGNAAGYNPETDPNVQGIRDATATRKQGYDDYLNFIEDFYKKQEEYDRQRQERDSRNAFWRSIGEVGASLVNLLGVSGAFSGRNAYGRGAYSSMQKFDLTTPKLTDKMWADIDKRKERMDALKERMGENRLKLAEILAGGQEKEGAAKAQGQKAYDDKAYRDAKAQRDEEHWKAEIELKQQIADNNQKNAEAALQETKRHNEQMEKGKSPSSSGGSGGSGGGGKHSILLNYEYVSNAPGARDGKMTITCPDNVMDKALEVSYREIADCLAQSCGYDNYAAFVATRPSNYRYNGDDPVEKALAWYYRNTLYTQNNDIPKDKETALLDWARGSFGLTQESGELIQRKVNLYDLAALTANTNENENEEEVEELEGNNPYNYHFMWNAQTQEQ